MIPIDSYHDALAESYVAEMLITSPFFTATAQSGGVAVIATSHDTAPAGSKYSAREENSGTRSVPRVAHRSVRRPPGWRWPAVATSTPSASTVHLLGGGRPA